MRRTPIQVGTSSGARRRCRNRRDCKTDKVSFAIKFAPPHQLPAAKGRPPPGYEQQSSRGPQRAGKYDTRAIQHYLGHRSIASTVRYTALAPDRFKGFWKD